VQGRKYGRKAGRALTPVNLAKGTTPEYRANEGVG